MWCHPRGSRGILHVPSQPMFRGNWIKLSISDILTSTPILSQCNQLGTYVSGGNLYAWIVLLIHRLSVWFLTYGLFVRGIREGDIREKPDMYILISGFPISGVLAQIYLSPWRPIIFAPPPAPWLNLISSFLTKKPKEPLDSHQEELTHHCVISLAQKQPN